MTASPVQSDLPGLPRAALTRALTGLLGPAEPADSWSAEVISGGLSNITYRLRWNERRLVLRRPPLGPVLPRAHDVEREYRVMSALAGTAVPVPATVAFCADRDVLGAPFYLMDEVRGAVLRTPADTGALTEAQRHQLSAGLVDVLAVELATLGDPVADLATMLTYWHDPADAERAEISVAAGVTAWPGFLTIDELTQRYAGQSGRDLSTLTFHRALAAMKLGVILEGVHARYLGGQAVGDGYDRVGPAVPLLAARGLRLLAGASG